MRCVLFAMLACIVFAACNKDSTSAAIAGLTGKWVLEPELTPVDDTLIFYSRNDSAFFFDKSVYYQVNMADWTGYEAFNYNYTLNSLMTDSVAEHHMTSAAGTWANVYLKQVSATEIEIGNFRQLDIPAEKYKYRKVE